VTRTHVRQTGGHTSPQPPRCQQVGQNLAGSNPSQAPSAQSDAGYAQPPAQTVPPAPEPRAAHRKGPDCCVMQWNTLPGPSPSC